MSFFETVYIINTNTRININIDECDSSTLSSSSRLLTTAAYRYRLFTSNIVYYGPIKWGTINQLVKLN